MSLLHDALLPGTVSFHSNHAVTKPAQGRPSQSQSHGGLLSPLVRLVRDPAGAIEGFVGGLSSGTNEDGLGKGQEGYKRVLHLRMRNATTYEEWRAAACELDRLESNDVWKSQLECSEYDFRLVQARLKQLDDARIGCDANRMLFLIRTSLTRGLGGMGDLRLYKHSYIGTKDMIERYIDSARDTIETLLKVSTKQTDNTLDPRHVLDQLLAARQAFGRSALLLSGGGTFGMNHIGVVKCLWEHRLLPRIISGSSAGSIVCAVLCTKSDAEMSQTLADFCHGDLDVFEREGEEDCVLRKAARFLKYGAVFEIKHLVRVMRNLLGDITFQEAYNRTRRILNICVSSASLYELPRLLNYVTAPNVIIWSAVAASCSVPFVFSAAQLLAKDPRTGKEVPWNPSPQRWIDGSVDNDLPMTRLAEMFNVNHFIVSQVNPHVVPFLVNEEDAIASKAQRSTSAVAAGPGWLHTMANLAKGEALHRMHVLAELGVFPNYFTKARSVLSQRYSGDITILPEISYVQFPRVLRNPTTDFVLQAMLGGERATWPKLSRIQNHCAIELALDDAVQQLRARVVFSPSQVDLRMNVFTRSTSQTGPDRGRTRRETRARNRPSRSIEPVSLASKSRRAHFTPQTKTAASSTVPQQHPNPALRPPHLIPSNVEPPSSSADDEDTGPYTSTPSEDDDEPLSSSTDSPPPSESLPTLWPTTRQLFPSASQPTSPSIASRLFPAPSLAMTPKAARGRGGPATGIGAGTDAAVPSAMTPTTPSSPEVRYKRMFHPGPGAGAGPVDGGARLAGEAEQAPTCQKGGEQMVDVGRERRGSGQGGQGQGQGLQLDISRTRGMLLRRKRSLSTGLAGLMPPKAR